MKEAPQRGEVVLGSARLETAWWGPGPGAAPTIALLHEGLGCVALWRDFPARLAAQTGCGVLAWSRRGYGHSSAVPLPRPASYLQDEARDAVTPVLDAMGVERCLLLGHSDGASIAAVYAGLHADARLRALALLAVHVMLEPICLEGIRAARARWDAGEVRPRLARYHADPDGAFLGWCDAWLGEGFVGWDIRAALPGIRVPTLVVQGLADPYGTVQQAREVERGAGGPVESLLLEGCGHHPQWEATEAVLAAVQGLARRGF